MSIFVFQMASRAFLAAVAVSCILLLSISSASSCGDNGGSKVKRSPNFGSRSSGPAGVASQLSSVTSGNAEASQGPPDAAALQSQASVSAGRRKRSPNFGAPSHPSQSSKATNPQGQPIRIQSNRGQANRGPSYRGQSNRGPQPQPSRTG